MLTRTYGTFFIKMIRALAPGRVAANYPTQPIRIVVIENLAGADGSTLLMGHIGRLAANPSVKANNVKELVALALLPPPTHQKFLASSSCAKSLAGSQSFSLAV